MKPYSKAALIDGLREGIKSEDWHRYTSSPNSLRVRIYKLRQMGLSIVSVSRPNTGREGCPRVIYRMEGSEK